MELNIFIKTNFRKRSCFLLSALSAERKKKNKNPLCPPCLCGELLRFNSIIFCLITLFVFFAPDLKAAESADELYRQGRFSEAEKAYAQGDMDHPKNIRYRYNRGCAAYQNGDYQSASAVFSSVLRRAENESIQHKAAYNLGNTAFKQGDFESAIHYYKKALVHDSTNEDARYNLELALREKQKKEQQKKEDQQQQEPSEDQKQEQNGQQNDKGEQKPEEDQQQKQNQSPSDKDQGKEGDKQQQAEQDKAEKEPQDLSGELSPRQAMEEGKKEEQPSEEAKAGIDKKKAEALLDNIQEDPSRILRFQIPREKRRGVSSGKTW